MQGFLLSIRVVTPILLMLCVGMLVRRLGWVDEKTLNVMDRLGFKLLLSTQLFYSLYRAEWDVSVYGKPLLASIVIILIILVLVLLIFGRLEPDPKRRGPVIQCEIRVNFVIFGMAIIASLYGSENTGLIAIMAAIIIPLTSTISAILFEVYRGGRVKPAMLLLNIIKNPYLIGAALGLIFLLLRIPLPQPVEKTVSDIGGMATPYCLIVLGGSIHLSRFGDYGRSLWLAVLGKSVIIPLVFILVFIPLVVLAGFRRDALAALAVMLACPTAVSGYTLANQCGADGELAAQLIVVTTLFSVVTMFLTIWVLTSMALI
uniref:AEC family transporter n=1 Tax=Angelakisella sp. TaxID=1935177 RepID=UPI0040265E05